MAESSSQSTHLQVVTGNPSAEELAVVVAVLQAAAAAGSASVPKPAEPTSKWHRNSTILRGQITPGHGQWAASVRRGLN